MRELLASLTRKFEGDSLAAWSMGTLPPDVAEKMLGGIVGIEVEIVSIDGKFKLNQNRSASDQQSVIRELSQHDSAADRAIAELMRLNLETQ